MYLYAVSVSSGDKAATGKGLERNVTLNMNENSPPVLLSDVNFAMEGGDAPSPPEAPTAGTESENCPRCEDIFGKLRPSEGDGGTIQDVRMQVRRGAEGQRCAWPLLVVGVWHNTIVTSILFCRATVHQGDAFGPALFCMLLGPVRVKHWSCSKGKGVEAADCLHVQRSLTWRRMSDRYENSTST